MCRLAILVLPAALLGAASAGSAADIQVKAPPLAPPPFSWAGFHVGGHAGALVGTSNFSDPFGPSLFGDKVTTPGFMGGLQLGYDWLVAPRWVIGVGADASLLSSDGSFTCLQASITIVGSDCAVRPRALATFTGRLGYVVDPEGRTLIYGKGGAAWTRSDISLAPNNPIPDESLAVAGDALIQGAPSSSHASPWGWTVGAGFERALTPAWSVSLEYDYHHFKSAANTPETVDLTPTGPSSAVVASVPAGATSHIGQDLHLVKLGLNYRWGVDPLASWPEGSPAYGYAGPTKAPSAPLLTGWEFEGGGRYWYSSGRFQSDFPRPPSGEGLTSRLTYQNMSGHTGEVFARVDSPFNVFVKGFAGGGPITNGEHFDEDWGLAASVPTAYEVTRSDIGGSSLAYATADIGFNAMRGPDYKLGPFIGYNYYHAYMGTTGCIQLVAPASGVCSPPLPSNSVGTSESDTWHSLRVGIAGEVRLWDRFKLSGDLAYLPYSRFEGLDDHRARPNLTLFPTNGTALGAQTELILSYLATDNLSFGLGGRYWAMWTTTASQSCIGCEGPGVSSPPGPGKADNERFGAFLQAAYRFDSLR